MGVIRLPKAYAAREHKARNSIEMLEADLQFINEEFFAERVLPGQLDILWAQGWRHFGTHFFRYSIGFYGFDIRRVIPLRIRLADFAFSKSQRRVLRQNADLVTEIKPLGITPDAERLFLRHKIRFRENIPESLFNFITPNEAGSPCETMQVSVSHNERLIAESYFDVGQSALSGIYAMFDPEYSHRSLGIFTLLKEIEFARETNRDLYYLGYCYEGNSFYDYKKRFAGTEAFDWSGNWGAFPAETQSPRE